MRKSHKSFIAVFVSALMAASPAWAACSKKDLAGNYQTFSDWVDAGVVGWTRCIITVKNNGDIQNGTTCVDSDGFTATVTGGSLAISSACRVTGLITSSDGNSVIDHARFTLDRSLLIGVGHDVGGDNFTFTAQRM